MDFKEPLVPIPHIQLIAEASDMTEMVGPAFARRRSKARFFIHDDLSLY